MFEAVNEAILIPADQRIKGFRLACQRLVNEFVIG
jgi:hypothetical protein